MRASATFAVLSTFAAGPSFAAEQLSVSAALSERAVPLGDTVTLEIRAVARVNGNIELEIPPVDGLTELGRSKSEGTSIAWSNAGQQITREQSVTVDFSADRPGRIEIPPVVVRVGNLVARSNPMVLEVGGGGAAAAVQATPPGEVALPDASERNLFLRYRLSETQAYIGQEVILDLEIFADPSATFSLDEVPAPPELDGFWREILLQPQRLTPRPERIGGRNYQVYRVWRIALFPLEAGKRTIEPVALGFAQGRSMFSAGKRLRRRALPVELEIKPLPSEGRPADFAAGNVGQYQLTASVDQDRVPAGKALVLTLRLSGRGNVKNARLPQIDRLEGFRVFPPTVSDDVRAGLDGITGEKKAEILLMPKVGGRLEIPSLPLTVFEPFQGRYVRLSTPSLRVVVEGTPAAMDEEPARAAPSTPKVEEAKQAPQLRPIRFRSDLTPQPPPPWRRPGLLAAFFAPPLLYLLLLLGGAIAARSRRETAGSLRRAAARAAKKRLEGAQRAVNQGDLAGAYGAFAEAFLDLGSQRLGASLRGLTKEDIGGRLSARGLDAELVALAVKELETADYAKFAPTALSGVDPAAAVAAWSRLLAELERLPEGSAR